jgi:hypothetical protein
MLVFCITHSKCPISKTNNIAATKITPSKVESFACSSDPEIKEFYSIFCKFLHWS